MYFINCKVCCIWEYPHCELRNQIIGTKILTMTFLLLLLSHFSHVWLCATLWTAARQVLLSTQFSRWRVLEWIAMPTFRGSNQLRVSCTAGRFFTTEPPGKPNNSIRYLLFIIFIYETNIYRISLCKVLYLCSLDVEGIKCLCLPFSAKMR